MGVVRVGVLLVLSVTFLYYIYFPPSVRPIDRPSPVPRRSLWASVFGVEPQSDECFQRCLADTTTYLPWFPWFGRSESKVAPKKEPVLTPASQPQRGTKRFGTGEILVIVMLLGIYASHRIYTGASVWFQGLFPASQQPTGDELPSIAEHVQLDSQVQTVTPLTAEQELLAEREHVEENLPQLTHLPKSLQNRSLHERTPHDNAEPQVAHLYESAFRPVAYESAVKVLDLPPYIVVGGGDGCWVEEENESPVCSSVVSTSSTSSEVLRKCIISHLQTNRFGPVLGKVFSFTRSLGDFEPSICTSVSSLAPDDQSPTVQFTIDLCETCVEHLERARETLNEEKGMLIRYILGYTQPKDPATHQCFDQVLYERRMIVPQGRCVGCQTPIFEQDDSTPVQMN